MPDTQPQPVYQDTPIPPTAPGLLATFRFFAARMVEDEITRIAASLSFTTTLQVVPALALVLAILTAFPAFEGVRASVQDFIFGNFMPDTGVKMKEQFTFFVEAAGKLTAFGVIGLIVTTLWMLLTIEGAFNKIFRVIRHRPLRTRLLVLWAMVTVGPFLIGLSFTLFGYFGGAQVWFGQKAQENISLVLGQLAPTMLAWIGLTFIYLVVPNRRILVRDALVGSAVAAVLLAMLRYGFAAYVASMTSYEAVYGALAAVPVFLVWIYFTWIVVMAGAVITATLPDWHYSKRGGTDAAVVRVALALDVIARLAAAQNAGGSIQSRTLAKTLAVPDVVLMRILDTLRAGRFVAVTDEGGWMLSRDLDRTALADIVHQFGLGLDFPLTLHARAGGPSDMAKRLSHHLARAAETERATLSVTLAKIIAVPDEPPAPEQSAPVAS